MQDILLTRIQNWYQTNCNDDWEHIYGFSIGTIDNPGWVLQDKKIAAPSDKDTVLSNLLNMYKRFESDEVPGAVVQASVGEELLM